VVERVAPDAPASAQEDIEIVVKVLVLEDGTPAGCEAVNQTPGYAEAAANAVRRWTLKPGTIDGTPAPMTVLVIVRFETR
jgi:outer membrane biosynthesis protein TonB